MVDLLQLMRWSHTYDVRHLAEARRAIAELGRTWVECKTLEDVFAATCYLRQRT